ncbi:MAG TPA: succinate dehydrogenase assembly factor 2 [Caulobacteraceae bacterium]|nr:succinate dehydrogenase assembly factor 2 [Caulobacteraceae bacterium]
MDDLRLKRIRHRAWRRGFREADLVLGPFADAYGPKLTDAQLDTFEALLDEIDHDVYDWVLQRAAAPARFEANLLPLIRAFHDAG